MNMNRKQAKTLEAIFTNPVPVDIPWREIESLILALDGNIFEARGSRICVLLNKKKAVFHRPHPQRVTDPGAVKSVRRFLIEAGVMP